MKERHPNHARILAMVLENLPFKQIAHECKAKLATVQDIANTYTKTVRVQTKFDPGEGQKSFWRKWQKSA
jgi:hypothetical protein